jgi:hypothetical protein
MRIRNIRKTKTVRRERKHKMRRRHKMLGLKQSKKKLIED